MAGTTIPITPTSPPAAGLSAFTHTQRTTAQDIVDQLLDYLGADVQGEAVRACKEAILDAYTEFITASRWMYYQSHGRLFLNAPFSTSASPVGTATYLHSSGTYPRQLTFIPDASNPTATLPSWAGSASIRNGTVTYDVERRISDTIATLDAQVNPGADITTPFQFVMYQDTYTLPEDFQAQEANFYELILGRLAYLSPAEWLAAIRRSDFAGQPTAYCLRGDPHQPGRLAVSFVPYPIETRTIDLSYQRLARKISIFSYSTGSASVAPGPNGTSIITGSGTNWIAAMKGSVIRLSSNATDSPTRIAGENPFAEEGTISTVDSATQVTIDGTITNTYNAVKYIISDPIDVESGAMRIAFQRCCEKQVAIIRQLKDKGMAAQAYNDALILAREADARDYGPRSAGRRGSWHDPIRSPYGLRGPDIS